MDDIVIISNAIQKAAAITSKFEKVMVGVSGGADSDIMLDMLLKAVPVKKMRFVFFDTGIEYSATKEHLNELEKKYGITIERVRPSKPVPLGCREYGLPFLSKFISQMIERLQNKGFDFAVDGTKSYEELVEKFPNAKGALRWWCNKAPTKQGMVSQFNINLNVGLKEFMIANPPDFKISDKCCFGAKKNPSKEWIRKNEVDLCCLGIRKNEGGIRSVKIKSCFDNDEPEKVKHFRPIFWFNDSTKDEYCKRYGVEHSRCYTEYGYKRTGCAGCPFNSKFNEDLAVIDKYEPMLGVACRAIFGKSYEYTNKYKAFKEEFKRAMREEKKQGE